MKLFQIFTKKPIKTAQQLSQYWLGHVFNDWIHENKYVKRAIEELLMRMPQSSIEFFGQTHPIIFLPTTGHYSCAISHSYKVHLILILPELMKSLQSGYPQEAWAILAHELGHIRYSHSERSTTTLESQVEADYFAFLCGLGIELENVLKQTPCIETSTRICYLTSQLASKAIELYEISEKSKKSKEEVLPQLVP